MSTGNPLASSTVKHSIVIHLDKAIFLGLGSTNIPDFRSLRKSDMSRKIFNNLTFTGDTPFDFVQKLVTDLGSTISYSYNKFDLTSKTYSEVSIDTTTILQLIQYHEKNEEDGSIETDDQRKTIRKIQNSLEGAIVGHANITTPTSTPPPTGSETQASTTKKKVVSIFFLKSNKGNARKIVPNGIPMIADYPRTEAGTRYSFGETVKHQQSGVNGENIGVYQTLPEDTDNPLDKVAAPLRMSYDRSTGTWNVSNQVLVVAADNIPSANVRSLDEIDALTEGALTPSDFSVGTNDQKPQKGIGNFFTGRGVVFSPERGNPNLFTPNFCACEGGKPVEIIRIVNRSNSNIAKGALLLCNYISGEWIPTVIKEGTFKASAAKNWAFSQFVVSSDFFFKDNRFYTNRTNVEGTSLQDGDPRYSVSILPSYKSKVRLKYYADWAEAGMLHDTQYDLVKENWARSTPATRIVRNYTSNDWDLDIPSGYFQFSNFDFVSHKLGGQCSGTILGRTNISYGESTYRVVSEAAGRGDIITVGYDFPHFWGAVLTEGYTTATTANLIGQTLPYIGSGVMVSSSGTLDIANDTIISREWAISRINGSYTGQQGSGLFADQADVNFKQLPADIATHASPSGVNGSPIKMPNIFGQLQSLNVYNNLRPSISFLKRKDGKELYDLRPNNANIIQFTPLSYHTLALDQTRFEQGFNYGGEFTSNYYSVGGGISPELNNPSDTYLPDNPTLFIYDAARDLILGDNRRSRIWPSRYQSFWRPLNPFLRSTTVKYAPFPWDGTWSSKGRGANTVGIIGASTTVNLAGQKEFPISIEQNLGVRPKAAASGGGGFSIFGTFTGGNFSTSSTPIRTKTVPLWGNNDAQDSLGGAVLYLQVYEAWEPKDTWFDARYNTVFHFNPEQPSGNLTKEVFQTVAPPAQITNADYTNGILSKNFRRTVDEIVTDVEHRVPSIYNHGTKSHDPLGMGLVITKDSKLAPINEWRVERCRNNKLLPFTYEKLVISLNRSSASIINAGSGFSVGNEEKGAKGVIIKVKAVDGNGGITDFSLIDGGEEGRGGGEGFLPADFAGNGYDLKIKNATIRFTSGKVNSLVYFDPGPQQVVTPTLISVPSKNGENFGLQSKEATVKVGDFTTANSFDLFFWFQNDVTYTPMFFSESTRNQYIKVALN
jgi:hypothetical protein